MVLWLSGVMYKAGAAAVDAAGEEGHAKGLVVGDALQCADKISALQVLFCVSKALNEQKGQAYL